MNNQNLIIYQFSSLYQILKELEINLNFKITEVLSEKNLDLETKNLNYIIITKKKILNIQEQYILDKLPIKIFIINNQWMGMVRQWQELIHGSRYSESYTDSLPDFIKLADSFGIKGIRAEKMNELQSVIDQMLEHNGPVLADICVAKEENCFPMIPSGSAHYDMILNKEDKKKQKVSSDGLALV